MMNDTSKLPISRINELTETLNNLTSNIITDTSNNEIIYSPSKDDDKEDKNTPSEDKKEEETKKDYKNPETGVFLPMLPILILALASIVVWSKVKNKFMRI